MSTKSKANSKKTAQDLIINDTNTSNMPTTAPIIDANSATNPTIIPQHIKDMAAILGIKPEALTAEQILGAEKLMATVSKSTPATKDDKIEAKISTINRLRDQISNNAYWLKQWGASDEQLAELTSPMEVKQIQVRTLARKAKEEAAANTIPIEETPIIEETAPETIETPDIAPEA